MLQARRLIKLQHPLTGQWTHNEERPNKLTEFMQGFNGKRLNWACEGIHLYWQMPTYSQNVPLLIDSSIEIKGYFWHGTSKHCCIYNWQLFPIVIRRSKEYDLEADVNIFSCGLKYFPVAMPFLCSRFQKVLKFEPIWSIKNYSTYFTFCLWSLIYGDSFEQKTEIYIDVYVVFLLLLYIMRLRIASDITWRKKIQIIYHALVFHNHIFKRFYL